VQLVAVDIEYEFGSAEANNASSRGHSNHWLRAAEERFQCIWASYEGPAVWWYHRREVDGCSVHETFADSGKGDRRNTAASYQNWQGLTQAFCQKVQCGSGL
jgi:hypothetical protein